VRLSQRNAADAQKPGSTFVRRASYFSIAAPIPYTTSSLVLAMARPIINAPAANTPYFTPAQIPAAGSAVNPQPDGRPIAKPFQPLTIRGLQFHNRIWVRPGALSQLIAALLTVHPLALAALPVLGG
jgi:hypothetical protein